MNVLVVCQKDENWEIHNFNIAAALKAEITWSEDSSSAVNLLLRDHPVDLLICDNSVESMFVLKYLVSVNSTVPYILVDNNEDGNVTAFPDLKLIGRVVDFSQIDELSTLVGKATISGDLKVGAEESDFCRIATELLLRIVPLRVDIYIRLSKLKFVKMFKAGQMFKPEDAQRYVHKKKIQYLYVHNDDVGQVLEYFKAGLGRLVEPDAVLPEDRARVAAAILDSVGELGNRLGFTEDVQEIAKKGVEMTIKSIGASPKLRRMAHLVKSNRGTYFSSHSVALAHVACGLAAKLEWPSETTFVKLTMAALFHDIVFRKPHLAEIETLEQLEKKKNILTQEDIDFVKNHPMAVAQVLGNFKEVPPDVDVIVAQHHERPDGSGFPRKLTSNHIAPLAALFIVAHDLVLFIYESPEDMSLDAFNKRFKYTSEFARGTFAKAISAIDFPLKF